MKQMLVTIAATSVLALYAFFANAAKSIHSEVARSLTDKSRLTTEIKECLATIILGYMWGRLAREAFGSWPWTVSQHAMMVFGVVLITTSCRLFLGKR